MNLSASLSISSTPSRRVAVISGYPTTAQATARWLEMLGHTAEIAHDGHEGWQLVLEMSPDVVMTGIALSGLDGFQLASKIRDSLHEKPVLVALTGYSRHAIEQPAREAGFDLVLTLPASVEELTKAIAFRDDPEACLAWRL